MSAGFSRETCPTSDKAHAANVGQVGDERKTDAAQFTGHAEAEQVDDKAFADMAARAARAGAGLYRLADGGFLLTRWSMVRELPDLRAVGQLLTAMGVR